MKILPTFLSFAILSVTFGTPWVQAQQPPANGQNVRKEHLEYCVSQLTVQVAQLQAIEAVKKNPSLSPGDKLKQIAKLLSPEQKEQLMACMQQPMPSAKPTPE
jgi:Spy/CpxP family protein refolding chaperone